MARIILNAFTSRKKRPCTKCKNAILPGERVVRLDYYVYGLKVTSKYYHPKCLPPKFLAGRRDGGN